MKIYIQVVALALLISTGLSLILAGKSDTYIKDRVVKLSSDSVMCTGEQVRAPSGVDYILTAGHCAPIADAHGLISVTTQDGKVLKRKIIAEDAASDLLLLEGLPNVRGLDIAESVRYSQSVRTFTHGSNLDTHKTEGELIENKKIMVPVGLTADPEVAERCKNGSKYSIIALPSEIVALNLCVMSVEETVTTAKITPGSSGGPAVDASGDLVGVASATDGDWGYLVPLKQIKDFLHNY